MVVGGSSITLGPEVSLSPALEPDGVLGPGLVEVDRGKGPPDFQYWIAVASVGNTSNNPFCPSSVAFRWKTEVEACTTEYLATNQIRTRVYKQFGLADLNAQANARGYGSFQLFTESPPCVQDGDLVTVTIRPYHLCLPNPLQIEDPQG